jgi:ComF family protein
MALLREKWLPRLRAARAAALDVAFPRWCVSCGGLVETGELQHLCETCLREVAFVRPPHCATCGWPFFGEVEGSRRCPHCAELDPAFAAGRTGFLMRGAGRVFLHELKYHQGLHLRTDLRGLIRRADSLREFVRGAVLVPVPLHPSKLRERGFNQAQFVAEALAAEGAAAGVADLLARTRDTPSQTRLDRAARERNMRGAFEVKPGAMINVAARYVVVDDVITTGATLNACAQALHRAGAVNVDIATLGHG